MDTFRRLVRQRRFIAGAVVTLITLGIVGVVVVATTSAGCSLVRSLAKTTQCPVTPLAVLTSSPNASPATSPLTSQSPTAASTPAGASSPSPTATPNSGPTVYPPWDPASSPGFAPGPEYYPPLANAASGPNFPGIALSCRLPIYAGGPGSGGFIVFPGSTFVADPRSAVTAPSPSTGASPTPPPFGGAVGWWGTTYDAKYSKWLPVPYAWVSPDGSRYAYPLNGDIYVQSVAGGAELDLGTGQHYNPIDVENDGVYVVANPNAGLWFLPFTGAAKQITAAGYWQGVANGAAYGTSTSSVPQGAATTILKLDLKTGASSSFFTQPEAQSNVVGFDLQGHPIIQVGYRNGLALFIATGPGTSKVIAATTYSAYPYQQPPPFPQGMPIADVHGLWFPAGNGLVLYANGEWYPMSSIGGQLAGQCA